MRDRRFRRAVGLTLFGAFLSTAVTGLFADALGVERSLFHRYSAYSLVALAWLHLYLNRRGILSWLSTSPMMDENSDGIGDTPYEIPGGAGAKDSYPLAEPYSR